jgi:sigma-B regulation protein RsbU (phosphoserine phosphatase)
MQKQFKVKNAGGLADGLDQMKAGHPDLVLLALKLPDSSGVETFTQVHETSPNVPVVILVSQKDEPLAEGAMRLGAQDYLLTPELTGSMLARTIRNAIERNLIRKEHQRAGHLLKVLMDNIPDSIYFKDTESHFMMINRAHAKRFGLADPHLAVGKSDADFFKSSHAKQALADEQRIMETGEPIVGVEEKETWADGHVTWVSTTKMPLRDRTGRVLGTFGISRDVTAHREVEQSLADRTAELSKERVLLRTLIDNLPDSIYAKDTGGRKTLANPADLKNLRCKTEADAIGKNDFDLFPKDVAERFWADDQKVLAGRPVIDREEYFLNEKGEKLWLLTSKLPLRARSGKIVGLIGVGRNITRRKQAEEALARERLLLRTLIDNLPDVIFVKDAESRFTVTNTACVQQLGASRPEEVLGKSDADFVSPELAAKYRADEQALMQSGRPVTKEESTQHKIMGLRWSLTTKVPLKDQAGNVAGLIGIARDITEHKLAEDKLAAEKDLFQTLLDNLPDSIYFKDRESRFVRVNQAKVERTLKTAQHRYHAANPSAGPEELPPHLANADSFADYMKGKTDFDFYAEERARLVYEDEQDIIRTGQPSIGKVERGTQPDGSPIWIMTTKMPWRDKDGQIIGTFGVSRDITPLKQAEEQLAAHTKQLEQKNKQNVEELKMARELQLAMLPHEFPCVPRHKPREESHLEFFSFFSPMGSVSGDFFAILPLSDTTVGLFVCDVMGHDVRAALVTAMMRALVSDLSTTTSDPGVLLAQINHEVSGVFMQTGSTMYATAFYLIADLARGEFRYANAAHPEPILVRRSLGTAELLGVESKQKKGPALGLFPNGKFPTHKRPMEVGDLIALFTDGLIETEGQNNEAFSSEQLLAMVRKHTQLPANQLVAAVIEDVKQFSANAEFEDDVCIAGVEVKQLGTGRA